MGVVSHTMRPARLLLIVAAGVLTGGVAFPAGAQRGPGSVLIVNATVYDGTGAPGRQASVRVVNELHKASDKQKRPWRFGGAKEKGERGYSDHFPVTVRLHVAR